MGQPQRSTARRAPSAGATQPLYTRTMPGGGYVRVELLVSDRGAVGAEVDERTLACSELYCVRTCLDQRAHPLLQASARAPPDPPR